MVRTHWASELEIAKVYAGSRKWIKIYPGIVVLASRVDHAIPRQHGSASQGAGLRKQDAEQ
jgi:hypothetical protein